MLLQISIQNFVLIEKAALEFGPGLNVVTGETGAGKSIFLAALSATFGEKISVSQILPGCDALKVISTFDISGDREVQISLDEMGIDYGDHLLSLRREVSAEGRNRCYVNDVLVKIGHLKALASRLIDMHGQHQNQHLFQIKNHQLLFDRFLGHRDRLESYQKKFDRLVTLKKNLAELMERESRLKQEKEFLQFTTEELKKGLVSESQYRALRESLHRLEKIEKVSAQSQEASERLQNDALPHLQKVVDCLEAVSAHDSSWGKTLTDTRDALYTLEETKNHLGDFLTRNESPLKRIDEINTKLATVERLQKKHLKNIAELHQYLEESEAKLSFLDGATGEKEEILNQIEILESEAMDLAVELHVRRKKGVDTFTQKMTGELAYLGMEHGSLSVHLKMKEDDKGILVKHKKAQLYKTGLDHIEFVYASTRQSPYKKLTEVASGGEISRIMLALKNILFENIPLHTMVFDEIDTGIGGKTAFHVGKKINSLSKKRQLIVITHLPQIAKFSDIHFLVTRTDRDDRTTTSIQVLSEEEKIREIARMIAGSTDRREHIELAKQFLSSSS